MAFKAKWNLSLAVVKDSNAVVKVCFFNKKSGDGHTEKEDLLFQSLYEWNL